MKFAQTFIGIGFGVSTCRAAWVELSSGSSPIATFPVENQLSIPSCFYSGPEGTLVGALALSLMQEPERRQNLRSKVAFDLGRDALFHIGDQKYSPVQIATSILAAIKREAERKSGSTFSTVTVAYPVSFDSLAIEDLRLAAESAGFVDVTLCSQAQAAAEALYASGRKLGTRVLVLDIGAVRTDLTILAEISDGVFEASQNPLSSSIAGDEFDQELYSYIMGKTTPSAATPSVDCVNVEACRRVKEALSDRQSAQLGDGPNATIERAEFEGLIRHKVQEIVRLASVLVRESDARGRPVESILLTGGGSRIPLMRQLVQERLTASAPIVIDDICTNAAVSATVVAAAKSPRDNTLHMQNKPGETPLPHSPLPDNIEVLLNSSEFKEIADEAAKRRLVFLLVGRTGVGKSSTVNSLLGWKVAEVGDDEPTTFTVQDYPIKLNGVPFTVVDTPGLCDGLGKSEKEDNARDHQYLGLMQKSIKELHCLWFISRLDDTRVTRDEKRAIRLLSEAFQDGPRIWQSAVIVFTHAGQIRADEYAGKLAKRSELIRREIAEYAGETVAANVPAVAVDNRADTTPDGKPWRGELYVKLLTSMKREGIITWILGTSYLLPDRPHQNDHSDNTPTERRRYRDELDDGEDIYTPSKRSSSRPIDFSPEQTRTIVETVRNETVRRWEERGRSFGDSVGRAIGGSSGASTGASIGASVGSAIGKLVSWFNGS